MTCLTASEADCLDFIEIFMRAHVVAPSLEDLRTGLGYASKSRVFRMLDAMQDKGAIARRFNLARSIEVLTPQIPRATTYETQMRLVCALAAPVPTFPTMDNIRRGPTPASDTRSGGEPPPSPTLTRAGDQFSEGRHG